MKTVIFNGRFSPPHKGHISVIIGLLSMYDRVIVVIGSCYEVGTSRHPLLAIYREKMLIYSLKEERVNLNRVSFVHLPDFSDFKTWWERILVICRRYRATTLCTGNFEDIITPLNEGGLKPDWLKMINPEKELPRRYLYQYHATDLRNAIKDGDYELFLEIASPGTIALMANVGGFVGIRQALANQACRFVPGRQAVDAVITTEFNQERWILCGYRSEQKRNFPGCLALPGGGISLYESPVNTALREVREETGLNFKMLDASLEPAHVILDGMHLLCEMKSLGIFSTTDKVKGGNQGGSSQPFHFRLDVHPTKLFRLTKESKELSRVEFYPEDFVKRNGLAYQQLEMVNKAGFCL